MKTRRPPAFAWLSALALALAAAAPARAIDAAAGTGGAAFLRIGQGSARAMGLGQAFVALAEGSDALTWNPAGLALTQQKEFAYSYMRYIQNIETPLYVAYAQPVGRTVWGGNLAYLGADNFDVRDVNGVPQAGSTVHVRDGFGSIGLGRSFLYEKLFLGAALRGVHEDNAGNIHDSIVGDVGAIVRPNSLLSLGCALQNFGTNIKNVASIARVGAGLRFNDFITMGFELSKAEDTGTHVGIGWEFQVPEEYLELGQLTFRVGWYNADNLGQSYGSALKSLHLDRANGLSFGFGLFTSQAFGYGLGVDYAFVPMGALGTSDQISLKVKF